MVFYIGRASYRCGELQSVGTGISSPSPSVGVGGAGVEGVGVEGAGVGGAVVAGGFGVGAAVGFGV